MTQPRKPRKNAKAAEQKFGKDARRAAERSGKKPGVWKSAERERPAAPAPLPSSAEGDGATISRTIEASASEVFRAFNDPRMRGWCHEAGYAVRRATAPRSLVLGLQGSAGAQVAIERRGNTRTLVTLRLTHGTDPAAWRASLDRLSAMVLEG
jgi:hypothetical protein